MKQILSGNDLTYSYPTPSTIPRLVKRNRVPLVEKHPNFVQIERDLILRKDGIEKIAKRWGIKYPTLQLYWRKHLAPRIRATAVMEAEEKRSRTQENLDWVFTEAKETVSMAKEDKDYKAVASLLGVGVKAVEILAEVRGELRQHPVAPSSAQISLIMLPKLGDRYEDVEVIDIPSLSVGRVPPLLEDGEDESYQDG